MMKLLFKLVVILISILSICCGDNAGAKIAINKSVIDNFERKFLPLIIEQFGKLNIPDTKIDVTTGIGTLNIFLTNIHFEIHNLLPENINISFLEPNIVKVLVTKINGKGNLNAQFKLSFISETDSVDVTVSNLNIDAEATLSTQESKKVAGKLMPSAFISKLNIDIDFDFEIHGSVIAFVADIVKRLIKQYINDQIQTTLKQVVIAQTQNMITKIVDQLPVYAPISENGLSLDYSLLSAPKVSNGYVIVNSNGAIVNVNIPESLKPPFPIPTTLPDFDANGKQIQLFLSDYSINTAINTVFLSNMLDVKVKSEDVPKESPIQFNTSSLETLIAGISEVYGKDKPVDTESKVIERPNLLIDGNRINGTVITEISLFVRMDNGTSDEALKFQTTISSSGDAHVEAEGQISAHINSLQISKSTIIRSKVKDVDINSIQVMFNFASKIFIPILNNNYLKKITVKLPVIEGITFGDSTVEIKNNYVELNVNPRFNYHVLFHSLQNVCVKKELEIEREVEEAILSLSFLN